MKKSLLIAYFLISLIPGAFAASVDKVVTFDRKVHDFGDIALSDGAVSCTFTFKNISDSPIVVHTVVSSCGCTTPEWTKQPVLPGKEGIIKARFSNDQGEGAFDKSLTVYISNVDRPVVLRLRGFSHEKEKDIKDMYDVLVGPLGFHKSSFSLGYVDQGSVKEDYVKLVNTGRASAEVSAENLPEGISVTFSPAVIPGRGQAEMRFKIDLSKFNPQIWGRKMFGFKLRINGKLQPTTLLINAMVKDSFNGMTKDDIGKAPELVVDKSYFEFGQLKKGAIAEGVFSIRNKGKETLVLHAIDSQTPGSTIPGETCPIHIPSGKSYNLKVRFDSSKIKGSGETVDVLSVITNDPGKPVLNLFISGIITE